MFDREYAVFVLPAANDRVVEHVNYLMQVSVSGAMRLHNTLDEAIHSLKFNPGGYPVYFPPEPIDDDTVFRYCLCNKGGYRIVFEVADGNVYIHDVQDCRQDTDKNLV